MDKMNNNLKKENIVGKSIKQAREEKHISQEVLSSFANISRTHLSAIERGLRTPNFQTFYKLAYALKMKPSELQKRIEDEIGDDIIDMF